MSKQGLSAQDLRAAAEVHGELGPDYSDAVVDSFFEKIDKQIESRVDARLAELKPTRGRKPPSPVMSDPRRSLLAGMAIGGGVTGATFTVVGYVTAGQWSGFDHVALSVWAALMIAYLGFCVTVLARKRHDHRD